MNIPEKIKNWLKGIQNSSVILETRGDLRSIDRGSFRGIRTDILTCFDFQKPLLLTPTLRPSNSKLVFQGRSRRLEEQILNESFEKGNDSVRNRNTVPRSNRINGKGKEKAVFPL